MGAPHLFDVREDLASQGPFAISGSDPDMARALVDVLNGEGASAGLLDAMGAGARTVILTEGLSGLPVTERHWQVLDQCRIHHQRDARIVLLQPAEADDFGRLSGLAGLSRTLRQEWPRQRIATWSLPAAAPVEEKAALILRALAAGLQDADLTVDGASVQQIAGAPRLTNSTPSTGNVWFAPGGARGVTSACVMELARRQPGSVFVLAGRSGIAPWPAGIEVTTDMKHLRGALIAAARASGQKPSLPDIDREARTLLAGQEIRATLDAITASGAQAVYLQADMSDRNSIVSAVDAITQQYGPITGLVHGAGVLADGLALKKTREDLAHVFGPKVEGLAMLLDVLDPSRLRHVGLFSSASAVFGNTGQSDYAMANAWLGAVARKLAADLPDAIVKSFCWGPWAGGMVDSSLAGHFAARGISLIGLEDGARIFAEQILQGDRSEVELLIGDEWAG
jgi:NAD(P)-dependent dehydrogenase (short-subunit alcohol dehydrogenase family)